jgi:hypothetical protein
VISSSRAPALTEYVNLSDGRGSSLTIYSAHGSTIVSVKVASSDSSPFRLSIAET